MATVVLSAYNVANFPEGGGHLWVYMQYAQALRSLGCEVYWLEQVRSLGDEVQDAALRQSFLVRMERFGLREKVILYTVRGGGLHSPGTLEFLGIREPEAKAVFRRADLLLNFHYTIAPELLACFRRTALVDIDPGLLQFWMSRGQLVVPAHHHAFTTGENVGTPAGRVPECGVAWKRIRPPVCLELWPYVSEPGGEAFTTISNWQGEDWMADGERSFENSKRVSFLEYAELPGRTPQPLELALFLTWMDLGARRYMERHGWRIRESREVAATPEQYQAYIRSSRGEFSCAKPSCMMLQAAWVSDRSLCYLASGKPVVVQDTGPSSVLPNGLGMFRFSTLEEAAEALARINEDYPRHCRAARELAEAHFDARRIVAGMLDQALA